MRHLNEGITVKESHDIDFWDSNKGPFNIRCVSKNTADLIAINHADGSVCYITKEDLCNAYTKLDGADAEGMIYEIKALKPKDWWDPGDGLMIYVCLK